MDTGSKSFYRYFPISERDRNWGLYITTAGDSRIGPQTKYPPAGHPKGYDFEWERGRTLHDHQLVYISTGSGWFESEFSPRQRIEAGTVCLLFPGVWHRYMPEFDTGWHEHWLGFDGKIARSWVNEGFFSPKKPVLKPGREDLLMASYTEVMEAIRSDMPALQQVLAGTVSQLLGLLYSAQQATLTGDDQALLTIQKAIGRMRSEMRGQLELPALARELNVSYTWFRRTFTQHTGSSPHQYLLELRLARARNLLSETSLAVKEAARQTGFQDEHYFSRMFRERIGMTPTQWRARAQRGKAEG